MLVPTSTFHVTESFRENEKSTCGAATGTFTVDIGEDWSKADIKRTESERAMDNMWHAQRRATEILKEALEALLQHEDHSKVNVAKFTELFGCLCQRLGKIHGIPRGYHR